MESQSLTTLAVEHLAKARGAGSGRSAVTLHGGHENALRQTLLALLADHALGPHESPGEATLQVVQGSVRLTTSDDAWEGRAGDFLLIPPARHDLTAVEDSVVLLTVAVHGVPGT